MPIADMTVEEMQRTAKTHLCGVCFGPLNVAWVNGAWVLRCKNLEHNTITRRKPKSEREKEEQRIWRELNKVDSNALMAMPEAKMLERVGQARFPKDLTLAEKKLVASVAVTYGLDPLMHEISVYQGSIYVQIDGRLRKAQETGLFDGVSTRPATQAEREAWEVKAGDKFIHADVFKKGASHPFEAWGRVTKEEIDRAKNSSDKSYFLPIVNDPMGHAEKRAVARGLKRAFHIPLPSEEDIGFNAAGKLVDTSTGEVIEGTATVIESSQQAPPAPAPPIPPVEPAKASSEATTSPTSQELTDTEKLLAHVVDAKPNLKSQKTARGWLVNVAKIEPSRIDAEPGQVWTEIRDMIGMAGKEL